MALTPDQVEFFRSFGYLHLPGYMADDIAWIEEEHARLFVEFGVEPDGERGSDIIPFIAQSDRLIGLLEHPKVLEALTPILGEDFIYLGSDGHYYSGEVDFHPDGSRFSGLFVKFGMYLDALTPETGTLRVIPGSCHPGPWRDYLFEWGSQGVRKPGEDRQRPKLGPDMPAVAFPNQPGDVILFNHNTFHASFNGNAFRRMFAINVGSRAKTKAQLDDLDSFLKFCQDTNQALYSQKMLDSSAAVRRRIEQPAEREVALLGHHRLSVTASRRSPGRR